jgi:hypothetical protein
LRHTASACCTFRPPLHRLKGVVRDLAAELGVKIDRRIEGELVLHAGKMEPAKIHFLLRLRHNTATS